MNHLKKINSLNNRYFILRHGQSKANIKDIFCGDPEVGKVKYGLTKIGEQQVKDSVNSWLFKDAETIIYSSPFKRTMETANIAKSICKVTEFHISDKLVERKFSELEGLQTSRYREVWGMDKTNNDNDYLGAETVNQVLDRTTSLIIDLEKTHNNKNILLVGHGDPLQILNHAFHRPKIVDRTSLPSLYNANLRELIFK